MNSTKKVFERLTGDDLLPAGSQSQLRGSSSRSLAAWGGLSCSDSNSSLGNLRALEHMSMCDLPGGHREVSLIVLIKQNKRNPPSYSLPVTPPTPYPPTPVCEVPLRLRAERGGSGRYSCWEVTNSNLHFRF